MWTSRRRSEFTDACNDRLKCTTLELSWKGRPECLNSGQQRQRMLRSAFPLLQDLPETILAEMSTFGKEPKSRVGNVVAQEVSSPATWSKRKAMAWSPNQLRTALFPRLKSAVWLLAFLPTLIFATNCLAVGDDAMANPAPRVIGKPRITQGHPCTLWNEEDITCYQELLTSSPELKAEFDQLRLWGDKRITQPLNIPAHTVETDGKWTFPAFKRGYQDPQGKWMWEWNFNTALQQRSADVSNLGILYALTGNEQYAAFAKQLLLALADAYGHGQGSTTPDPYGYDHFQAYGFDGGDTGMFLSKSCS